MHATLRTHRPGRAAVAPAGRRRCCRRARARRPGTLAASAAAPRSRRRRRCGRTAGSGAAPGRTACANIPNLAIKVSCAVAITESMAGAGVTTCTINAQVRCLVSSSQLFLVHSNIRKLAACITSPGPTGNTDPAARNFTSWQSSSAGCLTTTQCTRSAETVPLQGT